MSQKKNQLLPEIIELKVIAKYLVELSDENKFISAELILIAKSLEEKDK